MSIVNKFILVLLSSLLLSTSLQAEDRNNMLEDDRLVSAAVDIGLSKDQQEKLRVTRQALTTLKQIEVQKQSVEQLRGLWSNWPGDLSKVEELSVCLFTEQLSYSLFILERRFS